MRATAIAVRDGVVNVAADGRPVAAREAASQIAAPGEIGQRPRRGVARLGRRIGRMEQRPQLCRLRQFGDQLGRDERISADLGSWGVAAALNGGLVGDHMNDHRACRFSPGRAIRPSAFAGQPLGPGCQCTHRVGATLHPGARIGVADAGRQRVEPLIQRAAVRAP